MRKLIKIILISFIMHEVGHVIAIWYYRLKIEKIKFVALGLEISTSYNDLDFTKKLVINLAGPIVNIVLASVCMNHFIYFAKINFYIFLLNILPVVPLDGSKVLEVILERRTGIKNAKMVLIRISKPIAIIFIILGIIQGRYNIIFIGIYIIKNIKEEIEMLKINGMERIINRKERFLKKGVYPIRHIAVLNDGMVSDVLKNLDFDSIHIINVLDRDLNMIAMINEEQVINQLIEKGTSITFNDIIKDA